jgi:dUTP pyrophosphatase
MKSLKVYRRNETVSLPEFATQGSACFDLKSAFEPGMKVSTFNPWNKEVEVPVKNSAGVLGIQIHPGYRVMIPTGLFFDIDDGYVLKVYSRSGTALKKGLLLVNSVGIVDSDYTKETYVLLYNTSDGPITINNGDRVAQAMLERVEQYQFKEISEPPTQKTNRQGGFGSTGV